MNRRSLLGRLAAVAAAVSLAPAAKAEAAPVGQLTPAACPECGEIGATELIRQAHTLYKHSDVARQAYRDGYERREFIEAMREESRAKAPPALEFATEVDTGLYFAGDGGEHLAFRGVDVGPVPTEIADHVRATVKYYQDAGLI